MKLKSYFAGTVEAAMAIAREELGPEAMLVQSKRTVTDARKLGRYEVVFALQDAAPAVDPPPSFAEVFTSQREPSIQKLSSELEQLRHRIESMSGVMQRPVASRPPDRHGVMASALVRADMDPLIAAEIAREANGDILAARKAIESRVRVDSALGVSKAARKIVALVGPAGAGKTTSLVKLAIGYGLKGRRSMHLLSCDVYRIGAAEQLRAYAAIAGVGFQTIETPQSLEQALEEQRHTDLIFIDTPALTPRTSEFAGYLGEHPEIDIQLVLPVSSRSCDLATIVDAYAPFRPNKLLFTRIDEASCCGPLVNESHRTGNPISFLSTGQEIPEDLEAATSARIVDLILGSNALSFQELN